MPTPRKFANLHANYNKRSQWVVGGLSVIGDAQLDALLDCDPMAARPTADYPVLFDD